MQCFQNNSVFCVKGEKQGTNHHMRNQQAAVCRTTAVAAVTLKMVSLPTLIRTPLTGHMFFWDVWGAGQLWHRDVTLDNAP